MVLHRAFNSTCIVCVLAFAFLACSQNDDPPSREEGVLRSPSAEEVKQAQIKSETEGKVSKPKPAPRKVAKKKTKKRKGKSKQTNIDWPVLRDYESGDEKVPSTIKKLVGKKIALRGYVLPLNSSELVSEILLMPYPVSCIHVPPPPPNQMARVELTKPMPLEKIFGTFEVTGKLKIVPSEGDFSANYELLHASMTPFEGDLDIPVVSPHDETMAP